MMCRTVDDVLERVTTYHIRVMDLLKTVIIGGRKNTGRHTYEDSPAVDCGEETQVEIAVHWEEVDIEVVWERLEVSIHRVESV
jgi:hypothetical protein